MPDLDGTPAVTVITLTRNRPSELRHAVEAVRAQRGVEVEHIVVADRCPHLSVSRYARQLQRDFPGLRLLVNTEKKHWYLPSHIAALRAAAAVVANGAWIAPLDDDNTFEPDHCRSLMDAAEAQVTDVAHSWRTLWSGDGAPWCVSTTDPWVVDAAMARRSFRILADEGVLETGNHIVKDMMRLPRSGRIGRVDTNEWFLRREAYIEYGGVFEPTPAELRLQLSEDVILTVRLVRDGVAAACSQLTTVRYTMGGYSNEKLS